MYRPTRTLRLPLIAAFLAAITPGGVSAEADESPAAVTFQRLESLVGTWEGAWTPGDIPTTVSYRLTGNGSAVVEDYEIGERTTMSTLYHLDGDRLMLTHYCGQKNQPRMLLAEGGPGSERLVFDAFDVTNVAPGGGYSDRLTLDFLAEDRISLFFRDSTGGTSGVELRRLPEPSPGR